MIPSALLTTELQTDPTALGYAALITAGNIGGLVTLLNDTTKGGTLPAQTVDARMVVNAVVPAEYSALTQPQRDLWRDVVTAAGTSGVRVNDAGIRAIVVAIWATGTTTRTNLSALQNQAVSRVQFLFGFGTIATQDDVVNAIWNPDGTRKF